MPSFSVKQYNALLSINDAHGVLLKQLNSANKSLHNLITDPDMTRLFVCGPHAFQFGICVLHRHHKLEEGERMVSSVADSNTAVMITEPSTDTSSTIFADRWMPDGSDFEHTISPCGQCISPPPPAFFEEFRRICSKYRVTILGICLADLPLDVTPESGNVLLEEPHPDGGDRRQRTTIVPKRLLQGRDLRQSAWVPIRLVASPVNTPMAFNAGTAETQKLATLSCLHNCTNHILPLEGPTLFEQIGFHSDFDDTIPTAPPPVRGFNANNF